MYSSKFLTFFDLLFSDESRQCRDFGHKIAQCRQKLYARGFPLTEMGHPGTPSTPLPFRNSRSAAGLSTVWRTWFRRCWASMLPRSVRRPFSLQNVMRTVRAFPVLWSNDWHVLNGGEYRWRLTAGPVWLAFSTRCKPIESGHRTDGNLHCRSPREVPVVEVPVSYLKILHKKCKGPWLWKPLGSCPLCPLVSGNALDAARATKQL